MSSRQKKMQKNRFDDTSLLSTPNPIHSSSTTEWRPQRASFPGDASFNTIEELSDLGARLKRERALAASTLTRMSSIHEANVMGLPSRFLKPSEVSNSSGDLHPSESTINESDLLQSGNTSTPRESVAEQVRHAPRPSRGSFMYELAHSMKDSSVNFDDVMKHFTETIAGDGSFCSNSDVLERLAKDEMSWKREKDIPASVQEFSLYDSGQHSMGSFFKQRSDNLSTVLAKSPEKVQKPVALIDVSTLNETNDSLSISTIAKILSDTNHTPNREANYFLNAKKKTDFDKIVEDEEERESRSTSPRVMELYSSEDGNKENVNTLNVRESGPSSLSSRSPSALSNLPSGKLPIATTKIELVWGCVKQGKTASQSFVIKNKSSSRVGIICTVSNPWFRLYKDGSENCFSNILKLILHPHETRSLGVTFAPTGLGAAFDRLQFTPMNSTSKQSITSHIKLFGYGGHTNVVVNNIVRDTMGRFMLSLGDINDNTTMTKNLIVRNIGSLPSFVQIMFTKSGFSLSNNIRVEPEELVLLPEEEREVVITYVFNKDDFDVIQSNANYVVDVGKLTVTSGTEADRGRLRRLCKKAVEKNLTIGPNIDHLVKEYPGEVIPNDLIQMKEPPEAKNQILKFLHMKEIVVAVEQDLDRTLAPELQNETGMFNSLCEDTEEAMFESTLCTNTCRVEPSKIFLKPPNKITDMVFISNVSKRPVTFKVYSNPEGLYFEPKVGNIGGGDTAIVQLVYDKVYDSYSDFKMKILIDSEVYDVVVKVF